VEKDLLDNAKQYAFRLLGHRQRSSAEIAERLKKKKYKPEVVSGVVIMLERTGCLDDERYARDFIEAKLKLNPAGRKYFKSELFKKKIPGRIADKVLDEVLPEEKEYEAAHDAAVKLHSKYKNLDEETRYKKIYGRLARKGFSVETAIDILNELREQKDIGR
jgi:regulatory protein